MTNLLRGFLFIVLSVLAMAIGYIVMLHSGFAMPVASELMVLPAFGLFVVVGLFESSNRRLLFFAALVPVATLIFLVGVDLGAMPPELVLERYSDWSEAALLARTLVFSMLFGGQSLFAGRAMATIVRSVRRIA